MGAEDRPEGHHHRQEAGVAEEEAEHHPREGVVEAAVAEARLP